MLAFTIANLKMLARNRHALFWALFFPLLLVTVFGLFRFPGFGPATLAVVDEAQTPASRQLRDELAGVRLLTVTDSASGIAEMRRLVGQGKLNYALLIPAGFGASAGAASVTLLHPTSNPDRNQIVAGLLPSLAAEALPLGAAPNLAELVKLEAIPVPAVSYFDRVLLGLVSLGLMTTGVISLAVKISAYRNQSIFKRLLVTPLPIWKYFASEVTAQLALAAAQAVIILGVGILVFGAKPPGNLAGTALVIVLGSAVFLNIGFIMSAWTDTPAAASGMGNAIIMPMAFFSGAFFPAESLPWLLPQIVQVLPLTPMLDALRSLALESAPLASVWPQLAALGAWLAVTAGVAVKVFRFR